MQSLLPEFWDRIKKQYLQTQRSNGQPCKLVDLGCGTGRNTLQVLNIIYQDTHSISTNISTSNDGSTETGKAQIIGLDASNGMLDIARQRIENLQKGTDMKSATDVDIKLAQFDLLSQSSSDDNATVSDLERNADGMISTLVAEHIPLDTFFAAAASMLRPGALFLVTNMHAEMGRLSQAGFVDSVTGKKVRPSRSYAHEVTDILAVAAKAGFEVVPLPSTTLSGADVERVIEKKVTEDMVGLLGERSRKYVGVTVWLGVCFRKG